MLIPLLLPAALAAAAPVVSSSTVRATATSPACCAEAETVYPILVPGDAPAARSMEAATAAWLARPYEDGQAPGGPLDWMSAFIRGHAEFRKKFPDVPGEWSSRREVRVRDTVSGVAGLELIEEGSGGAHPFRIRKILNFSADDGRALTLTDLLKPGGPAALLKRAKTELRRAHGGDWEEFLVSEKELALPESFALDADGLLLYYDTYEIAAYVFGPQEVRLSWSDAAEYLKPVYSRP